MPQYYPKQDWKKRGKVTITPRPFIRTIPILKNLLPYHVGDKVRFHLHIEKPNSENAGGYLDHYIFEKFGSNIKQFPHDINGLDTEFEGNIINSEGDVEYSIGLPLHYEHPETIFTTKVENWDSILSQWSWAIVGAFFTLLCGFILWLLNFFQIIPFWKIWIVK